MAVVRQLAKWISQRSQGYIDNDRLAEGIRELRIKDGSTLTSRATASLHRVSSTRTCLVRTQAPRQCGIWPKLDHRSGLRQESSGSPIECTVLLKTDEISARVTAPIQVTRPRIVELILESCKPVSSTPGLSLKSLTKTAPRHSSTKLSARIELRWCSELLAQWELPRRSRPSSVSSSGPCRCCCNTCRC